MASRLRNSSSTLVRGVVPVAVALLLLVAFAPAGVAEKPEGSHACDSLDGKFENGAWVGGVQAPGITVTSFSDEEVAFEVAEGSTLFDLCVKSGREMNVYNIDAQVPIDGFRTVTVTKAGPGYGIGHISFDTGPTPPVTCPTVAPPDVSFDDRIYIDENRAGGEPVSVVTQDGSINVSAHAGTTHVYKDPAAASGVGDFAVGYFNQTLTWRSTDGGESWDYIGTAGLPAGPHSPTSTGFSDPDFTMDQAGNIYNVEIDLANVAVFKSEDDGQSYPQANPYSWFGDRPWLTALEENEVFLYVNLPKMMLKSSDGGVTWVPYVASPRVSSKSLADPLNPNDGLIGPVGIGRFAIGVENEQAVPPTITWTTHNFGPRGIARQFFGVVGVDNAGNVYQAAAGGYNGASDTTPNGEVSFMYYERETGRTNTKKVFIPTPDGDALWPWIIAGDEGRAAVVWYQSLAGEPEKFYTYAAVTHNALGTTVTCSDGHEEFVEPQFTVVNASKTPVFIGNICLSGTTCNANTNFQAGDRRLGDFFTVNFDHEGNLFIVSGDTMLQGLLSEPPFNGQKPVANPIFIKQSPGGDLMLERPMELRETRCLMNLPLQGTPACHPFEGI